MYFQYKTGLGTKNQTRQADVVGGEKENGCFSVAKGEGLLQGKWRIFRVPSEDARGQGSRHQMLGLQTLLCGQVEIPSEALAAPITSCLDLEDRSSYLVEKSCTAATERMSAVQLRRQSRFHQEAFQAICEAFVGNIARPGVAKSWCSTGYVDSVEQPLHVTIQIKRRVTICRNRYYEVPLAELNCFAKCHPYVHDLSLIHI